MTNVRTEAAQLTFIGEASAVATGNPWVGQYLTANAPAWTPSATFTYQWRRDGQTIAGAAAKTYKIATADAGHAISVVTTASKAGYETRSSESAAVQPSEKPIFLGEALPTITGILSVNQELLANPPDWTPSATVSLYQWLRDGQPIAGATTRKFITTPVDRGHLLSVKITQQRSGYSDRTGTSADALIEDFPPIVGSVKPSIAGESRAGQTLTASMAAGLSPAPTAYAYQWNRDGVPIVGGTGATYTIPSADIGRTLTVTVVASHPNARPYTATSEGVGPVSDLSAFTGATAPTISGTRATEQVLTAVNGADWAPAASTTKYQWNRDGQPIAGATFRTYSPVLDDVNTNTSVTITLARDGYVTRSWTSADSILTAEAPTFIGDDLPTVKGIRQIDQALIASPSSDWSPAATTVKYQWLRDGQPISGATTASYKQTAADIDHFVDVRLTATRAGYRSRSWQTAAAVVTVDLFHFAGEDIPTVAGERRITKVLTATRPTTWSPAPTAVTYQWLRDGQPISGARSTTYTQTADDVDHVITVAITATKSGVANRVYTSAEAPATLGADRFTGDDPVTLSTVPASALQVRAVKPGSWSPLASSYSYQWYLDGQPVQGAVRDSFTPTSADVGKHLTVAVTASKLGYLDRTWESAPDDASIVRMSQFTVLSGPRLTGKAQASYTLNVALPTDLKPAASKWSYQWFREGQPILNATKKSYLLTAEDVGKHISVRVGASREGYEPVSWLVAVAVPIGDLWDFVGDDLPWVSLEEGENDKPAYGNGDKTESGGSDGGQWQDGTWTPATGAGAGTGSGSTGGTGGSAGGSDSNTIPGSTVDSSIGIKGDFQVGWRIYAHPGNWVPRPTKMTYQWYREGVPIDGATGASYTPTDQDLGKKLQAAITGSKTGYKPKTWVSVPTPIIKPMPTFTGENLPIITGVAIVGAKLQAARPAGVQPIPSTVRFQWLRDGAPIAGKTAATYTLVSADRGHRISVQTTLVKSAYRDRLYVSAATAIVSG